MSAFPAVSTSNPARRRGASRICGRAGWALLKGRVRWIRHAFSFARWHWAIQRAIPFHFFINQPIEAPVEQLGLRLLCRLDAPSVVPPATVAACKTYRDAVKLCWQLRRVRNMTQGRLAEEAGLYAPHVTRYLHDGKTQRDLPAWAIRAFENICGNTAITQWLSIGAQFTILEEVQAERIAA